MSKWILCSDRLPEKGKKVIVTIWGTDFISMKKGESLVEAVQRLRREVRYNFRRWLSADGSAGGMDAAAGTVSGRRR